jgi:hypothetical protein
MPSSESYKDFEKYVLLTSDLDVLLKENDLLPEDFLEV